ncbi:MAG: hypothetical protein HFG00_11185 [Oscillibacter sp.]|nr:hypothetical protein [Oscillibacter sp.]
MDVRKVFAAVRGVAGALGGAWLAAAAWLWLALVLPWSSLLMLPLFGLYPAACLGYWCLRGLRNHRFAAWVTTLGALLALPLALPLSQSWKSWPLVCLAGAFFVLLSQPLCRERLLSYTNPAWYRNPWRIAALRAGGALYNYWPPSGFLPQAPLSEFQVRSAGTVLLVKGEIIEVVPPLRKGRRFSAWDVAGVAVGPSSGSNVLYDFQEQALARFGTADKNARLFIQYLQDHGVPFRRFDGRKPGIPTPAGEAAWEAVCEHLKDLGEPVPPEELPPEEDSVRHTVLVPPYRLQLRRTFPLFQLMAGGIVLSLLIFTFGFPVVMMVPRLVDLYFISTLAVCVLSLTVPFLIAAVKGQLVPPTLTVEGGRVWITYFFGNYRELSLKDIELRFHRSDACYILSYKNGKPFAKFSTRDDYGAQFMNFLTDHNIKLRE